MKAIIIAAGMGLRLNPLTNGKPKCLLELNGKTLLEHQVETLRAAGIERIVIIKGYKQEMINYPGFIYYINDNYQNNDILHSLFYAEEEMNDEFIAVYSDILYDKSILKRLLSNKRDICIVVDAYWRRYYEGRISHPIEEAENVIFDADSKVVEIGKILADKSNAHGEFIGMMKCSKKGAFIFKGHFNQLKRVYSDKPFQKASVFEKAYLTDMIQDLVDSHIPVYCEVVRGGWKEIDTAEDYEKVLRSLK